VLPGAGFQVIVAIPSSCETCTPSSTSPGDGTPSPTQTPLWQASFVVQSLPSLQVIPSSAAGFEQTPVPGLHVPASWHTSIAVQTTGRDPTHVPLSQASVAVQAFASLQTVPSGAAGFEQTPVAGVHVPGMWHASLAEHTTGFAPVHTPTWHVSDCVHPLPSVHVVPFALAGFEQTPVAGAHVPAMWH